MGKKQLSLLEPGRYVATRPRLTDDELRGLVARIHTDFKPVWNGLPEDQQLALAAYFLPWGSKKELIGPTRPQVLHWYCPFAAQAVFPGGHRYRLNVHSGCSHECEYCYAVNEAVRKSRFFGVLKSTIGQPIEHEISGQGERGGRPGKAVTFKAGRVMQQRIRGGPRPGGQMFDAPSDERGGPWLEAPRLTNTEMQ